MSEQPRYASLRDYLAMLRRQRIVVLLVPLAFGLAAFGFSSSQTTEYEAEATVAFRDIEQSLELIEIQPSAEPSFERASLKAETVTSAEVVDEVQKDLRPVKTSPSELRGAVTTRVESLTSLVVITVRWTNAALAAQIANSFAKHAAAASAQEELKRIDDLIKQVEDDVGPEDPSVTNPLQPDELVARQQLERLRAAQILARPSEVISEAGVPSAPASPKVGRNTVLGIIVGFVFAMVAAFVRDSLDRRLRASKDVHDELGLPVLGRVGQSALGSAGVAGNGQRFVPPSDLESFRVLRTNLAFFHTENPIRSVLITSGKPEEGKTTIAASLAGASAAAGQRTLLVEADLRRPSLAARLGVKPAPGLSDYLEGRASPQDILQTVSTGPVGNGDSSQADAPKLVCITAGPPPAQPAELLASPRCRQFIDKVSKAYDLVLIDSPPLLSSVDPLELIPSVDAILLCVRLSLSTRDDVRAVKGALHRLPDRPTGVVVTGVSGDEPEYGYYGYYEATS